MTRACVQSISVYVHVKNLSEAIYISPVLQGFEDVSRLCMAGKDATAVFNHLVARKLR